MAKIGFIGLGNMGTPMACNLVKKGHEVKGFDLVPANLDKAANRGVKKAASAADAAKDVDAVVTMLPAGKDTIAVWGGSGMLKAAALGTLIVDSSTIDVNSARTAHKLAGEARMLSLDAPVSGGVGGAEGATLTFMAGGSKEAFDKAKPILEAMGKRVVHCGEAGAGQAAKICNNMMLGISMIGVCEAFVLAEKLGLSHQALFDVASTSSGQNWGLMNHCPVPGLVPNAPSNNNYKPGFASALMLKDLKLAQEAAAAAGATTPMGAAAAQMYGLHNAWGEGGTDYTGIIHLIRGKGSLNVRHFVFDAYGTLFNLHAAAERHKEALGPRWLQFSQTWRTKHLEYTWVHSLSQRRATFWSLAERSLDYAAASIGGIPADLRPRLMAAYRTMEAYPEVREVLTALKVEGASLAILSNGDPDMLTEAVRAAKLEGIFDAVLSVSAAGLFKPAPAVYRLVTERFGCQPPDISFQSSNWWDIAGAKAFGFHCVWINRTDAPDEYPDMAPDRVARDLTALL